MKRKVCYLIFMLTCIATLPACATPVTYSAESIETWVVDADTKQPIEGPVVVADWVLEGGIHVDRVGDLKILETTTDKDGRFFFPAWGPIRLWGMSRLTYMDPELIIFKSGYEYRRLANPTTKEAISGKAYPVRRSQWHGKTIELRPFKGPIEQYAEHVRHLDNNLESARYGKSCEWKSIPLMLVTIHRLSEQFAVQGVKIPGWQIGAHIRKVSDVGNQKSCGSAEEFFRDCLR